jgi:hypothetical protein
LLIEQAHPLSHCWEFLDLASLHKIEKKILQKFSCKKKKTTRMSSDSVARGRGRRSGHGGRGGADGSKQVLRRAQSSRTPGSPTNRRYVLFFLFFCFLRFFFFANILLVDLLNRQEMLPAMVPIKCAEKRQRIVRRRVVEARIVDINSMHFNMMAAQQVREVYLVSVLQLWLR